MFLEKTQQHPSVAALVGGDFDGDDDGGGDAEDVGIDIGERSQAPFIVVILVLTSESSKANIVALSVSLSTPILYTVKIHKTSPLFCRSMPL